MFSYFEWFVLRLNEYQKVSMILSALTNTGRTVNTYVFLPVIKTFEKLVWWEKTSANGYIYDIYSLMFYTYRSGYMYIHTIFAKTGLCMYLFSTQSRVGRSTRNYWTGCSPTTKVKM